jgi:hypothetical protein
MLLVNNLFYFGTRDCLTHCHESVFEIHRNSFIEQLLPLFTQIKELNDKLFILEIFCHISSSSIHHALDPLSIFNTFMTGDHEDSPFIQQSTDLIYGLYPFIPCIRAREYYYLLRSFILHLLPSIIFQVDSLRPFESSILSNKFSFDHFRGYMNKLLLLMKKENLTVSALGLNETYMHSKVCNFSHWNSIILADDKGIRMFYLFLKNISCVLLFLNDPLTSKQVNIIIQRLLTES